MNTETLITDSYELLKWITGWHEEAALGNHNGVRQIHRLAANIKEKYCTNGLWNPDAEIAYEILRTAADNAQQAYEDCQDGIE